jgi:N-methylhydantoinase B
MLVEIVEGAIESTLREMEAQVDRTARSTVMREANEHVPAIYDVAGRAIASVSFTPNVDPILTLWKPEDVKPGDLFLWNHPYQSCGGIGHLPDLCLTLPVFHEGRLVAFVQEMGHLQDVGGASVGSMVQAATEVFQEGLLIPPVKLIEEGRRNEAVFRILRANTRFPDLLDGDVDAMIGGCRLGHDRILWLCQQHGTQIVMDAFDVLLERCERSLKEEVFPRIPNGRYTYEDFIEYIDVTPQEPREFIRIALTLEKTDERMHFDFTGTDRQVKGAINFPADERFYARALVTTFKSIIPEGLVINDGVLRCIDVTLPKGTVLSPEFPAACSYRHYPLIRSFSVALGVLARAMLGQVPQGADNMSGVSFAGEHASGERWYLSMPLGGGSCGRPFADGTDAVLMTPGRNVPCEYLETYYPLRVHEFGLNPDSGGAGLNRGGLGYRIVIEFLSDAIISVRTDRHYLAPAGVNGGRAAKSAEFVLNPDTERERRLPGKRDGIAVKAGDRLRFTSPGGGGWGDPLGRDAARVELDVRRGLVTETAAEQWYGVVVGDAAATTRRRGELATARTTLPMFDRGEAFAEYQRLGKLTLAVADDVPAAPGR